MFFRIVPYIFGLFLLNSLLNAQNISDEYQLTPVIFPERSYLSSLNDHETPEKSGSSIYLSRYNVRVYKNNIYEGLRYTEISGQLNKVHSTVSATFWYISESKRDLRSIAAAIDERQQYNFSEGDLLYSASQTSLEHLSYLPEFRNFPILPQAVLEKLYGEGIPKPGYSYESYAYRLIDPKARAEFLPFRVLMRYIYRGIGSYLGDTVHFFDIDFALRNNGPTGVGAMGSNKMSLVVYPSQENAEARLFIRNTVSETYQLGDEQIRLEGFGLIWIRAPKPAYLNPTISEYIASLSPTPEDEESIPPPPDNSIVSQEQANPSPEPTIVFEPIELERENIQVSPDPLGLKLSLPNIQFLADSSELVEGEEERVRVILEILKRSPENRILVIGHSASVGRPADEVALSLQRSERIAQILSEGGIPPGTIRYEGRGSSEAIASNATELGRAANRRVEIIILN